jgi:hypothetical protein
MFVSLAAVSGMPGPRTFCLDGIIHHQAVRILADLGSSHSILREKLATQLQGVVPLSVHIIVQVANGARLQCSTLCPATAWSVQGFTFLQTSRSWRYPLMMLYWGLIGCLNSVRCTYTGNSSGW